MGTTKENKKGFWASLFSSKHCSCTCGDNTIIEKTKEQETSCCMETEKTTSGVKIKEIKVLGPGCAKCKSTYQKIEKIITEHNLDIKLTKIEDIVEIMNYNIMSTPAVVIDGNVKIKGYVPSENEIKKLLGL